MFNETAATDIYTIEERDEGLIAWAIRSFGEATSAIALLFAPLAIIGLIGSIL